jgi:hypothetical protein
MRGACVREVVMRGVYNGGVCVKGNVKSIN